MYISTKEEEFLRLLVLSMEPDDVDIVTAQTLVNKCDNLSKKDSK